MIYERIQILSLCMTLLGMAMFCVGTFRDLNRPIERIDVLRKYA